MKDIDQYISRYCLANSSRVKKLIEPLDRLYGIDIFLAYKLDSAGNYSILSSQPTNSEYWHSEGFYKTNGFCSSPTLFYDSKILISNIKDPTLEKEKTIMKDRFAMDNECMVIKKPSSDVMMGFSFASSSANNKVLDLYHFTPHIFDSFIDYFLQESAPFRNKAEENAVSILPYRESSFFKGAKYIQDISNLKNLNQKFLGGLCQKKDLLTKAENKCKEYYLAGYTAQETADALKRSRRTIEAHFEHIRNKLNIRSKRELFKLYKSAQT